MKTEKQIVDYHQFNIILQRLSYQLIEKHIDFSNTVLLGIQPRGVELMNRICSKLRIISDGLIVNHGSLDITFFRDDFGRRSNPIQARKIDIPCSLEGKHVVLIDDVLFTGRSVRSAMDALMHLGRPKDVELLVLIDRRFRRHLPISANYIGKKVDTILSEKILVRWGDRKEDNEIILLKSEE